MKRESAYRRYTEYGRAVAAEAVVLQKLIENRKLLGEGIDHAATPKISAMNFTRSLTAPFSTFSICPFFIICKISYPLIVRRAVLNDLNPLPGLTNHLINLWSCSIRLFKYLFCRSSTACDSCFFCLSSSIALG